MSNMLKTLPFMYNECNIPYSLNDEKHGDDGGMRGASILREKKVL